MLAAARDVASQVVAVAFWSSATAGVIALLAVEALVLKGPAGAALVALMPVAGWGGWSMRRRVLLDV